MTNQIAIGLGLAISLFLGLDFLLMDGAMSLFLAKKFDELLEWLAFWR